MTAPKDATTPVAPEMGRAFDAIVAEHARALREIVSADVEPSVRRE